MKVKLYTKQNCVQCKMTKKELDKLGIDYEIIQIDEVDENGELTKKALESRNYLLNDLKFMSMPVVEAEGQEAFFGFRPDKLKKLKEGN